MGTQTQKSTSATTLPAWVNAGAQDTYTKAAAAASAPTAAYNASNAQSYMDPYEAQVKASTLGEYDRNAAQQQMDLGQQAQSAHAFGGDRQGVAQAQLMNDQARTRAGIGASLDDQAYQRGYADFTRVQNQPLDRYAKLAGILGGVPTNRTTDSTQSKPFDPWSTALGLGEIGASFIPGKH